MAVPNTDVNLKADIADECKVVETTNISLSSMMTDSTVGGIGLTFANLTTGGPCNAFEKIGGSNNPLQSTANSDVTNANISDLSTVPHRMSECIGGDHLASGGGPGR